MATTIPEVSTYGYEMVTLRYDVGQVQCLLIQDVNPCIFITTGGQIMAPGPPMFHGGLAD